MLKYKMKLMGWMALIFISTACNQFIIQNQSFSLWTFFLNINLALEMNISLLFMVLVFLFLLLLFCVSVLLLINKENHLKRKNLLLASLLPLSYSCLLFFIWPMLETNFQLIWGAYLSLALMVGGLVLIIVLPTSKKEDINQTSVQQEVSTNEGELLPSKDIQENAQQISIHVIDTEKKAASNSSTMSIKQLSKCVFLINIALFTSFFLTWNSNVDKAIGLVILLSGRGFFDFLSRFLLLLSLHILLSNILFFTAFPYFIPASFLNNILYLLIWLRALNLIGFVNMATAPLIGFVMAFVSLGLIVLTIRKNKDIYSFKNHLLAYFNAIINALKTVFKAFQNMIKQWNEE